MRLSVSLLLVLSLLSGGCHRGGERANPGRKKDVSKAIRVPRALTASSLHEDSKTVHVPEKSQPAPKREQGDGARRDSKTAQQPLVSGPGAKSVVVSSVSSSTQSVSVHQREVHRVPEGSVDSVSKSGSKRKPLVSKSKARFSEIDVREGLEIPKEIPGQQTPVHATDVGATETAASGVKTASAESTAGEVVALQNSGTLQVSAKPVDEPAVSSEVKEPALTAPSLPKSEESIDKGSKTAEVRPDVPEPIETAKSDEKPSTLEVALDKPVVPSASKVVGSSKPVASGGTAASKSKLPLAEKKKQTEAQKREEIQKAAEQSYEAGLQFIRESRDADAIKAFRQTVKLAPESADAWLRLAYLCEKEGKTEEALRAFKEAKRLWSF